MLPINALSVPFLISGSSLTEILEAGEDEEPKDNEESAGEESTDADSDAQNTVDEIDQKFSGLDLRAAHCFGYRVPKEKCWTYIADQSEDIGKDLVDFEQLEKSLAKDVDESYLKIAEFKFVNVDDGMAYYLWFDNNKALWKLEVLDSPEAEMTVEERADFFESDMFKKTAKKTYYRLVDAYKTLKKNVLLNIENGELLLVDTVKLEAIMHFLDSDYFLANILAGKHLSY